MQQQRKSMRPWGAVTASSCAKVSLIAGIWMHICADVDDHVNSS